MGRRRDDRLQVNLPVRVWGMDRNGKPFIQSAHTVDITRLGGRLRDLYCIDKKGEVIRVQHGHQKANFRVTWVGIPGTSEDGQVGIYCIEPDKYIWNVSLPKHSTPDNYQVAEDKGMLSFNEHPPSIMPKVPHSLPVSSLMGVAAAPVMAPSKGENRPGKKRGHPRYPCAGTVEVAPEGSTLPVWCILSDISISGCYAETTSPLPAQTAVHALLKTSGMQIHTRGVVRTSHPGVGMGINFTKVSTDDAAKLQHFVNKLGKDAEGGASVKAPQSVPAAFNAVMDALTSPQPKGVHKDNDAGPGPQDTVSRLQRLGTELWETQQQLRPNVVDARLVREFQEAVDHARHSAWAVQHWLELKKQNKDPFQVLQKLNNQRIRIAHDMTRRMAMDIDAGDIDFDSQGLDDLHSAAKELQQRLAKMLKKT